MKKFNDQVYTNESSLEAKMEATLKYENQSRPFLEAELQNIGSIIVTKDNLSRMFEDWSLYL